jgi:hypothetical protein
LYSPAPLPRRRQWLEVFQATPGPVFELVPREEPADGCFSAAAGVFLVIYRRQCLEPALTSCVGPPGAGGWFLSVLRCFGGLGSPQMTVRAFHFRNARRGGAGSGRAKASDGGRVCAVATSRHVLRLLRRFFASSFFFLRFSFPSSFAGSFLWRLELSFRTFCLLLGRRRCLECDLCSVSGVRPVLRRCLCLRSPCRFLSLFALLGRRRELGSCARG